MPHLRSTEETLECLLSLLLPEMLLSLQNILLRLRSGCPGLCRTEG